MSNLTVSASSLNTCAESTYPASNDRWAWGFRIITDIFGIAFNARAGQARIIRASNPIQLCGITSMLNTIISLTTSFLSVELRSSGVTTWSKSSSIWIGLSLTDLFVGSYPISWMLIYAWLCNKGIPVLYYAGKWRQIWGFCLFKA
jgi:hypothetical protein